MTARIFTILIGAWLFFSAFMWPHNSAQGLTALVSGAMTVFFALLTMYFSNMRYLTALTAVGLFVASFAESMHWNRTFWHNAIIAIAIFVAAMLDRGPTAARQERELYGRI